MTDTIIGALIGVGGAIIGAILAVYLAKKHGSTHKIPDVDKFLKESLLGQAAAIEQFRSFVSESDRTAYQDAWENYRYQVWNYGFNATYMNPTVEEHEVYERMIHDILTFAEIK